MRNKAVWDFHPRDFLFIELSNHGRLRLSDTHFVDRANKERFLNEDVTITKETCDKLLKKLKEKKLDMIIDFERGNASVILVLDNVYFVFRYAQGKRYNGYNNFIAKLILVTAIPVEEINKSDGRTIETYKMLTTNVKGISGGRRISPLTNLNNKIKLRRNQLREYNKKKKALKEEVLG